MNPLLKLALWELPPDCSAPLVAPADFVFRTRWKFGCHTQPPETELWMRTVPYGGAFLHFFCDGTFPQNGNWIVSHRGSDLPFSHDELDEDYLNHLFQPDNDHWFDDIARLVYFDGTLYGCPGLHRITVAASGNCCLNVGNPLFFKADGHARLSPPFKNRRPPTRAVTMKNELFAVLSDETSQARFALEWVHLSLRQQRARLFGLQPGAIAEMQRLLRAALQSQSGVWERDEPLLWRTRDGRKRPPYPDHWHNDDLTTVQLADFRVTHNFPIPPRLKLWKQVIWNYFAPLVDEELLRFADSNRNGDDTTSTLPVEVAPPTAHERLEASLVLRQWWQEKFASVLFDAHDSTP